MSDTWTPLEREREVFALLAKVIELPEGEREAALEGHDASVVARVRALIAEDDGEDDFLAAPGAGRAAPEPPARLPRAVGPYRPLELLGEGGMGRVYLAAQEEPVRRRVALKLLRFSVAGAQAEARFVAERHAMARLDHPNVGKLLEAGTTEDGQPYFAMELIDGPPITRYCDEHALWLDARLRLFVDVCRGVDHAHGQLLLHRDLKPSNVLVPEVDGRPVPKIIDFGIAKGLDPTEVGATLGTGDQLIGTPTYMSPEALGLGGEVGVRSDVFSLGVLLYELLTGALPWPASTGNPAAAIQGRLASTLRRPSTSLVTLEDEALEAIAVQRGTTAAALSRKLRGELDWIVLRAIASEPERRYASAAELADDLERYLRHEPISARPPSATYLLRKLVQRNRLAAAAAAIALAGVAAGIVGTSVGLVRARAAEERAQQQARTAVEARDQTSEVVDFLVGLFRATGLHTGLDETPPAERTARELLDLGAARIDEQLADQPLVRARMSGTIGRVYQELGLLDVARDRLETALALQRSAAGPESEHALRGQLAETLNSLGWVYVRLADTQRAAELLNEALRLAPRSDDGEAVAFRGRILGNLAVVARMRGDHDDAKRRLHEAIDAVRAHPDAARYGDQLAAQTGSLGNIHFARQEWRDAEIQYREALALMEELPNPSNMHLAQVSMNLGAALASQKQLAEAAPLFERALAIQRRMLGNDHPNVATTLHNLGNLRRDLGQLDLAETTLREALAIRERVVGPEHPLTAWTLDVLGRVMADRGRIDEARQLQRRALAIREREDLDPGEMAFSLEQLARLSLLDEDLESARDLYARALEVRQIHRGPNEEGTAITALELGEVEWQLGERVRAREHLASALAAYEAGGEELALGLAEARERIARLGAQLPPSPP